VITAIELEYYQHQATKISANRQNINHYRFGITALGIPVWYYRFGIAT
jgi:hypothetical protein